MYPENETPHESPNVKRRLRAGKVAAALALLTTVAVEGSLLVGALTSEAPAHDPRPGITRVVDGNENPMAAVMYGNVTNPVDVPQPLRRDNGIGVEVVAHYTRPDMAESMLDAKPVDEGEVQDVQYPPVPLDPNNLPPLLKV